MVSTGLPGFFGKVTSHGDFVGRRLAQSFQQPWDGWVQAGLRHSRQALGAEWLAAWLSSPVWRFALAPGVCGEDGWAGLMMPSVDRVGRHFPLTVAGPLGGQSLLDCAMCGDAWYGRLEELALSSLREDFSLEAFDAALCTLGGWPDEVGVRKSECGGTVITLGVGPPLPEQLADPSSGVLQAIAASALAGYSLWWTDGSPRVTPCLLISDGLPAPAAFTALLDGDWQAHGWLDA